VIWTDVVQMSLYVFGAIASFFVILARFPVDGPTWRRGRRAHKFSIFDFRFFADHGVFSRAPIPLGRSGGRCSHHRQPRTDQLKCSAC